MRRIEDERVLVVIGSALTSSHPRDIDVLYEGKKFTKEEERIVRKWAANYGLSADLPIDPHKGIRDGHASIPAPCGIAQPCLVLGPRGRVEVENRAYSGITSILRAYGNDPSHVVRELRRSFHRLAILPKRGAPDRWSQWESYIQGTQALRSAVLHCDWPAIRKKLGSLGLLLDRLIQEDPRPIAEYRKLLAAASPIASSSVDLFITWEDGWWIGPVYENQPVTPEKMIKLLWPE